MDARFVERMQRAIERGLERRPDGEAPERAVDAPVIRYLSGEEITRLDFSQAQRAARQWSTNQQRLACGIAPPRSGPYTVARAMADYLEDYRRRGGKASDSIESVARHNILCELGDAT